MESLDHKDLISRAVMTGTSLPTAKGLCPRCGAKTEPIKMTGSMNGLRVDKFCDACISAIKREKHDKLRAEMEVAKREARQRKLDELWERANLGPRYIETTFAGWEARAGSERAYEHMRDYTATWPREDGRGILLTGPTGSGKTYLAAAVVHDLLEKEHSCVFQSVPGLLRKIKAGIGLGGREHSADELTESLEECELLVLDDLGSERWTAWVEEYLYTLIDHRYRSKLPMIITTNLDLRGLESAVGTRILDRLIEVCQPLQLTCSSYRRKQAELRLGSESNLSGMVMQRSAHNSHIG